MTISAVDAAIKKFLNVAYRPSGYRAQLMVSFPPGDEFETAGTAAILRAGLDPARRLARMRPRPAEQSLRESDLLEFIGKYGHEYCGALLRADPGIDVAAVTTAAHLAGFPILWDVSSIGEVSPDVVKAWGVDAAVSTRPEFVAFSAI